MLKPIGYINEVKGNMASAILHEIMPPYIVKNFSMISSPRINSFIKTNIGLESIICQVIGEKQNIIPNQTEPIFRTNLTLSLKVIGYIQDGLLKYGTRLLPLVGAKIYHLNNNEYSNIFQNEIKNVMILEIGNNLFNESYKIKLSANKIIASHIAIYGNTGSGKSNTLSKIFYEYHKKVENKPNNYVILFDLNNEYYGDSIFNKKDKLQYDLSTSKNKKNINKNNRIPIDFSKFDDLFWSKLFNATEKTQRPIIKKALNLLNKIKTNVNQKFDFKDDFINFIVDLFKREDVRIFNNIKTAFMQFFPWLEYIRMFFSDKNTSCYFIDRFAEKKDNIIYSSQDYNGEKLSKFLEKWYEENYQINEPQSFFGDSYLDKFHYFILKTISTSTYEGTNSDHIMPLIPKIRNAIDDMKLIFEEKNISTLKEGIFQNKQRIIVNLSDVNKEVKHFIMNFICEEIFNYCSQKKPGKISEIFNIIIDEAHNILNENDKISRDYIQLYERIIKEGRKFGLFLTISSQRPSDISSTITSQIHNFFIHKIINPYDIEKIKSAVSYMDSSQIEMLSVLGPGECILTGTASNIPQFIKVEKLSDNFSPKSDGVIIFSEKDDYDKIIYKGVIDNEPVS